MSRFPYTIEPKNTDEKWMVEALKQAHLASLADEVPVGAVLVYNQKLVAKGHNQVEMLHDATAHAEMLCITAGSSFLENWRLEGCTLYTTLEPCAMCAGAIFLSRVPRVVWGAPDIRHGAGGSFIDLFTLKHPTHQVEVQKGVLENYGADLMRTFFERKRNKHVEANRKLSDYHDNFRGEEAS